MREWEGVREGKMGKDEGKSDITRGFSICRKLLQVDCQKNLFVGSASLPLCQNHIPSDFFDRILPDSFSTFS